MMRPDPPAYSRLGEIKAPSVLAIGDLDYPMVRDCAGRIARPIPGCRMIVVPGADHLLPLRAPDALAGIIGARRRLPAAAATASRWARSAAPGA